MRNVIDTIVKIYEVKDCNAILVNPNSREKSLAMTKLEECVMWANVSIARNE